MPDVLEVSRAPIDGEVAVEPLVFLLGGLPYLPPAFLSFVLVSGVKADTLEVLQATL
jgi:hypothetical protein